MMIAYFKKYLCPHAPVSYTHLVSWLKGTNNREKSGLSKIISK